MFKHILSEQSQVILWLLLTIPQIFVLDEDLS